MRVGCAPEELRVRETMREATEVERHRDDAERKHARAARTARGTAGAPTAVGPTAVWPTAGGWRTALTARIALAALGTFLALAAAAPATAQVAPAPDDGAEAAETAPPPASPPAPPPAAPAAAPAAPAAPPSAPDAATLAFDEAALRAELARVEPRLAAEGEIGRQATREKEVLERTLALLARERRIAADEAAFPARATAAADDLERASALAGPIPLPATLGQAALDEAAQRLADLERELGEKQARRQALADLPLQLEEEREGLRADQARIAADLRAWRTLLARATPEQRPLAERRVAFLELAAEEGARRERVIERRLALSARLAPVVESEAAALALRRDRAALVRARYVEEAERRAAESSAVVASVTGAIPFEPAALRAEREAVGVALAAVGDDEGAEARLAAEAAVLDRALAALARKAEVEAELGRLEQRRARAEAAAQALPRGGELTCPVPFLREHLDQAIELEAQLRQQLAEKDAQLKTLDATPDGLREAIAVAERERASLLEQARALSAEVVQSGGQGDKAAERRRLALLDVEVRERAVRVKALEASLEVVRQSVPVARLERDTLARRLEQAALLARVYQEAEATRLEQAARAAERERLAKSRQVEELRAAGFAFRALRIEAEAAAHADAVERSKDLQLQNLWATRLREVDVLVGERARRTEAEVEALVGAQTAASYDRGDQHLERLTRLAAEARRDFRDRLRPWRVEGFAARREARAKLDALAEARAGLDEWIESRRRRAEQELRAQQEAARRAGAPERFPDDLWVAELAAWDKLKADRITAIAEREGLLRQLGEDIRRFQELVAAEERRLVRLESDVRARSFWIRDDPIIRPAALRPAQRRLEDELERLELGLRDGRLLASALGALGRAATLARLALLAAAAALLVAVRRRALASLDRRLHGEVPGAIPWGARAERAGWRLLESLTRAAPFLVWATLARALFGGAATWAAQMLGIVVLGVAGAGSGVRVILRPHESKWRLVPLPDDAAMLAYRLLRLVVAASAAFGLAYLLVELFGDPFAADLRAALRLSYRLAVTTAALFVLATSPALVRRLIGLLSKRIAARVNRLLLPVSLFVGGSAIAAFGLEAMGYRNAAEATQRSLILSLGVFALGLVLDRLLFQVVLQRIDPHGVEDDDAASESATAAAAAEALAEPGSPEARRLLVRQLAGTLVSAVVLAGVVYGVVLAYQVEATTFARVLGHPLANLAAGRSLTLGSLVGAALTGVVTALVYRYFRGFMAHFVLPAVGLSKGARFAVSTVAGYAILGLGGVVALNQLHIYIGDFEWFLAAAGVGIGFGLQEILSNFVSGLIILIERPVEVGDVVTVEGVQGEITRITIRATTVATSDNVSIIVPNKNFITSNVINWSHGSPTVRIRIPVGVAYGADTGLVKQTLLDVAEHYGRILKKPPPTVAFLGFGASSLDFELAVWVPTPSPGFHRQVRTDLCSFIDSAFRKKGIEIPFNQMDIHIRHGDALKIDGLRASGRGPASGDATEPAEDGERERARAMARARLRRRKKQARAGTADGG